MNLKNLDYNIERTENCVLVDIKDWLTSNDNILRRYNISGKDHVTYITRALAENIDKSRFNEDSVKVGDTLALSRIVSDVAKYRAHSLFGQDKRYYDVPIMQVLGKFIDGCVTLDSFTPIYDKVLLEKVNPEYSKLLVSPNDNTTVCRVLKTGSCKFRENWEKENLVVKPGDTVLVIDNVTTELELNGKIYYVTPEENIVAIFKDNENLTLDEATFINESILMQQYTNYSELNSSLLESPFINFEELDYSDTFNKDLLEIKFLDNSLTKLKKSDIILLNRDLTNYVIFNRERYYITKGMTYVYGKGERI